MDACRDRGYHINSPHYFGQPKIDGQKALAFATPERVVYQSRSMKLRETPSIEIEKALMATAAKVGPFFLEGEVTCLDFEGGEHCTGAQAATYNIDHGHPTVQPAMKFFVFDCLYFKRNLRRESKQTRLWKAEPICLYIQNLFDDVVMVNTTRAVEEKKRLARLQLAESHEGEVWFNAYAPYIPGKLTDDSFVRTKYLKEFEANIISVAPTMAVGHFIGGFEIKDDGGKSLGNIGTGYSHEDQQEILARFQAGNARVLIRCQGFTETGAVWHGRFIGWA